mmetsp:Transcript_51542/g.117501  ORF Transcript_51542/g.117501 Transcript_51542/m.117501 type:complete len:82 (-) Transcript_51542:4-249(-)
MPKMPGFAPRLALAVAGAGGVEPQTVWYWEAEILDDQQGRQVCFFAAYHEYIDSARRFQAGLSSRRRIFVFLFTMRTIPAP